MEFLVHELIKSIGLIEFSGIDLSTFISLDIVLDNKAAPQSTNLINQSTIQLNQLFRIKHPLHLGGVITIFLVKDQRRCHFEARIPTLYAFDKNQFGF